MRISKYCIMIGILIFNIAFSQEKTNEKSDLLFKDIFFEAIKLRALEQYKAANDVLEGHLFIDSTRISIYNEIANNYIQLKQYQKAILYVEKGLKIVPKNQTLIEKLLELAVITEDISKLEVAYRQIVKSNPKKMDKFIDILIHNAKYDEALDIINNRTLTNEKLLRKNKIFLLKKDYKNALQTNQILLEKYPKNIKNYMNMILIYSNLGNKIKVKYYLSELNEKFPNHKYTVRFMINKYLENKNYKMFFIALKKLILNDEEALEYKKDVMLKAYEIQSEYKEYTKLFGKLARQILKIYPKDYKVLSFVGDCMLDINKEYAMECYRKSVERGNNDITIMQRILISSLESNNYEKLYTDSKLFLVSNPNQALLYYFNGLACIQLKKDEEAIEVLEDGLAYLRGTASLKSEYYGFLAQAYHSHKHYLQSDKYYEKAIEADESNLIVMNNYSYFLSTRGEKLDRALELITKVCQVEPNNFIYLDTYAWVLYKKKKFEKSREVIERTLTIGGLEDPDILEHYGDILFQLNKKQEAIIYWKKAIEKGGNKEEILKKLEL